MSKKSIAEALSIDVHSAVPARVEEQELNDDRDLADLERVRDKLIKMSEDGEQALDEVLYVAKSTEDPLAYEASASMMRTLARINGDIVKVIHSRRAIMKKDAPKEDERKMRVVNNNLFLSTDELTKLIEGKSQLLQSVRVDDD